jgi:hypothetical protein
MNYIDKDLQDPTITHQLFQLITTMSDDERRSSIAPETWISEEQATSKALHKTTHGAGLLYRRRKGLPRFH